MADSKLYAEYTNEALGYDGKAPAFDLNNLPPYNTDWFDAITRKGVSQNHNLSVSGGNDKATYYFSMGYKSDQGILDGNNYDRLTLRSNNTYKVTKSSKWVTTLACPDIIRTTSLIRLSPQLIVRRRLFR
ncbi:hypothetical protein [Prolixibacter sp. NT017]|uniref:hypothetical protein n=1 Tax=Prolixibacter sp. NT017 TaxID=2652390 RepID=UPI00128A0B57|nr:hypothetical protein [Prolixibacter sp. NT017]GET23673.1 hypothetical protein NT017_00020 [Prolixibacter sp. NT017]